jgi:sterol desaturase/sphingolipid hydroxylase (fatty acid hydroxylase superfamily)
MLQSLIQFLTAHPMLKQVFVLSVWLVILSVIFLPLERLCALHPKKIWRTEIGIDLAYYFLNGLFSVTLISIPLALVAWAAHRLVPWSLLQMVAAWPLWLHLVAALLVNELGYYWGHRWTHQIPFLWRFHAVHHSAPHLDFMVNTRVHPVDLIFVRLCGLIPLYVLGLAQPTGSGSLIPIVLTLIGTIWGFLIHANLRWRLGPLEWVISTPAFHHWHHTRTEHVDRNYAPLLPGFDALFGTLYLPRGEWPTTYGIEADMPSSLSGQLVQPLSRG